MGSQTSSRILLADDDGRDRELTLKALERNGLAQRVDITRDGTEVLEYLARGRRNGGSPAVIILDLKMPRLGGLDVLKAIRSDPALRFIPVVVFTSSNYHGDVQESYRLGANAYVVKPVAFAEFVEAVKQIGLFWVQVNQSPVGVANKASDPSG